MKMKKKQVVAGIVIVGLMTLAAVAFVVANQGVTVEVHTVGRQDIEKLIKETGTVESQMSVVLSARKNGEISGISLREGAEVTAGQLLLQSSTAGVQSEFSALKSQLSGVEAQYKQAADVAERNKELYAEGVLSYEEYQKSQTTAAQLKAQVSELSYSVEGTRESNADRGIKSPISGVITKIFVEEGESVTTGTPLFEISDLTKLYIRTDLLAEEVDLLKEGTAVRLKKEDGKMISEEVFVDKIHVKAYEKTSQLGVNQKRVTVEITTPTSEVLRLGSDLRLEIVADNRSQVLCVPKQVIFKKGENSYVYVVRDGKAKQTKIKEGLVGEEGTEILKGLEEGDLVILSPLSEIEEGAKVKVAVK